MTPPKSTPFPQPMDAPTETTLFGVRLNPGTLAGSVRQLGHWAAKREGGVVCVANVDMLTRARHSPALDAVLRGARLVVTDGMPLVWALRRLQGLSGIERVDGPNLMLRLCEQAAAAGTGVYLYGGSLAESAALVQALQRRWPMLRISGAESPPQLAEQPPPDPATVQRINDSGAGLLFVGLGCPKQEHWMQQQQQLGLRPLALGVGLAFALIAGSKRRAPAWMQRCGLEWAFRLAQEPRRLWRRYLVGNSVFLGLLIQALLNPRRGGR